MSSWRLGEDNAGVVEDLETASYYYRKELLRRNAVRDEVERLKGELARSRRGGLTMKRRRAQEERIHQLERLARIMDENVEHHRIMLERSKAAQRQEDWKSIDEAAAGVRRS